MHIHLPTMAGDEETFVLTVRRNNPPFIRCAGAPASQRPQTSACQTILNNMKASTGQTSFGARGIPDVDETLPQTLTERK